MAERTNELEPFGAAYDYAGFWLRVGAGIIDTIIILAVTAPLLTLIYGKDYWVNEDIITGFWDIVLNWIVPIVFVFYFWVYKQATPGKLVLKSKIVDANTGAPPTIKQWIIRYLGYFPATLALGIGLFWVGWDPRKQGWHDKLADTVVIRHKSGGVQPVKFSGNQT